MKDRVGAADCSSSYFIPINDRLEALPPSPPKHTIYKVHELLRRENAMAYEPEILAIGPYHRGKERLQAMEVWKLRVLKSFLELQEEKDATKYFEAMKTLEGKARECYSESIICNADEFAEMLLLDGCFIIQYILSTMGWNKHDTLMINHCFFKVYWVKSSLCRDMLLFENQIPLFVLEELFYLTDMSKDVTYNGFCEIAACAFKSYARIPTPQMTTLSNVNGVEHLLGLVHRIYCPPVIEYMVHHSSDIAESDEAVMDRDSKSMPSATKLHDSGVTLKKVEKENPFEVTFVNGVMEVPIFNIFDSTETVYRNMIAYEQYFRVKSNHCFGRHAIFMDYLIDCPEDVALLRGCGIIGNFIGDDEAVSTMCNKLCKHIIISWEESCYGQISKEVNAHCRKRRHRWMAKLRRDYFNNPWSFISFLAAVFLLLLTFTQTVFSVLGT